MIGSYLRSSALGLAFLVSPFVGGGQLCAQAAEEPDVVELPRVMQFAIPEAPALEFIGGSAGSVERPTALRSLASSLLSGIGADGRVRQGLALEVAPVQLLRPTMDAAAYVRPMDYALANLGLSLGTVRAAGEDAPTRLAVGMRVVLLDWSDPHGPKARRSAEEAIFEALQACLPRGPAGPVPVTASEVPEVRRCVAERDSLHRARYRAAHWNDWAVSVGGATGIELPDSRWTDPAGMGGAAWAVVGIPGCLRSGLRSGACARTQLLAQGHYASRDPTSADAQAARAALGLRAIYGGAGAGLFAEVLNLWRLGAPDDVAASIREWSAGLEFRVGDALWVSTGLGSRYAEVADRDASVVMLAGLRFNVAGGRRLSEHLPIP